MPDFTVRNGGSGGMQCWADRSGKRLARRRHRVATAPNDYIVVRHDLAWIDAGRDGCRKRIAAWIGKHGLPQRR